MSCESQRPHLYDPIPHCPPMLESGNESACFSPAPCQVQAQPELACPQAGPILDPCHCMADLIAPQVFSCMEDEAIGLWLDLARCQIANINPRGCGCHALIYLAAHLHSLAQIAPLESHAVLVGATKGAIAGLPGLPTAGNPSGSHLDRTVWGQLYKSTLTRSSRPGMSSGRTEWGDRW
jgi:hypothetical protein